MTAFAIAGGHFSAVRFVALCTEWDLAMGIVAEAACECGVFALDLFQLNDLLCMAGEALISDVVCQLDYFRSMRVVVAPQTAGKIVVRLATVALAAGRNDLFNRWRMAGMAILATYLGFVCASIGGNCLRCCRVTLDTISVSQYRLWISRSGNHHRHAHQQCRQCDDFQHGYQLVHLFPPCFCVM